jgi:xanthine dehydrogenase YagR molybdenum-binding subunit
MTDTPAPWSETKVVGRSLPRIDADERVSGTAVYALDVSLPDMLHAAVLRCPHAHARVGKVDTREAARASGVRAVVTGGTPGADLPWYVDGRGTAHGRLFDPHCRHEGEEVAAVAAETLEQARDALAAIRVEYEGLPFVIDAAGALAPGAPAVQEGGNRVHEPIVRERGDVAVGFAGADLVLEETYESSCEVHTPMEVHGSVARWDGDRLTVWDTTQGVFGRQRDLARVFGLPLGNVRVVSPYMGGGFGSKLETGKYTVIAALLARKAGRPVKLFLTREETFLCVGNRPAHTLTLKAGARKDGTLTALSLTGLGVVGAYPSGAIAGYQVSDLYLCPNVRREETSVLVNAGPARPMRAPGFPQCSWALEQMLDALAERLGMDPVELRLRNVPTVSQERGGRPYTSTGFARCLREGATAFGWKEARARPRDTGRVRRGVGVAGAMWGYDGDPKATALVKLASDGSATLVTGASDIGTGTKTILAMVVAEELGVPLDRVRVEHADTLTTLFAPASGGSQTALVNAPAARAAAADVKRQLLEIAAFETKRSAERLSLSDGQVVDAADPSWALPLVDLKGVRERENLLGVGRRQPHPEGKVALPFAAHFAEVEVDTLTGEIRVLRLLGAHDSGRVLNLLTYRNQVFGGMAMGIGFGLTERRTLDPRTGRMVNANWLDYRIPTALDVPPEPVCLPIDPEDRECNDTGVKGLGEPATIPTAAAIANAVRHATGIRMTRAPITRMEMVRRLAERRGRR